MSQGFTPEFLEELKYKCDIVEIISQYVALQKKGGRYFGCCPFHSEKTGSFCVNQADGFYHCFGCGASGDVIKFIMEIESIGFYDAVKYLAAKAGMPLPEVKIDPDYNKKKAHRDVLKAAMVDAAKYYRANLVDEAKGKEAREYLASRGLTDETAHRYALGLSLDGESMVRYMRYKGYTLSDLAEVGLIANANRPYDAFENRIIVPIINSMEEVVAFGGRIYHGEQNVAKYKNSTNTPLFDKGRTIYGVNYIKRDRKQGGQTLDNLILVEGYMDVISLGAAGINNAVAGMGTALTEGQARDLKRLAGKIYVCYDGDGAGRHATIRNADTLVNADLDVRIASLPDGKDPDETVRSEGKDGFLSYLDKAVPVIEYKLRLIEEAYELGSLDGRAKYAKAAAAVLKTVSDPSQRAVYAATVAANSRLSEEQVLKSVGAVVDEADSLARPDELIGSVPATSAPEKRPKETDSRNLQAARTVLRDILSKREYCKLENVNKEWFELETHKKIFELVSGADAPSVGSLYSYIDDGDEIGRVLNAEETPVDLNAERLYSDSLTLIANAYISRQISDLTALYGTLTDPEEKRRTVQQISKLQKQLNSKSITQKL